jgi:hypothetical protein
MGFDPDGNIWIADTLNGRIQRFSPDGEYLGKVKATGNITVDAKGNLWVMSGVTVKEYFPEDELVTQFGESGSGEGQFKSLFNGIATDSEGNLWVVDFGNGRVSKWKQPAAPAVSTEVATGVKRSEATLNATVNPQGKATSYQFEWGATPTFGKVVPAAPKSIGSGSTGVKASEALSGLKYGTTYYYHVVATGEAGTVYGETRHFSTMPGPGAEAKWRIGGKTLAELGLKSESFSSEGPFSIEIPAMGVTFKCTETATGLVSGTNAVESMNIVLSGCKLVGSESKCTIKPIYLSNLSGTGTELKSKETLFSMFAEGAECPWPKESKLAFPTLYPEVGNEAVKVPVLISATGSYGVHAMYFSGSSQWKLTGVKGTGKELGLR